MVFDPVGGDATDQAFRTLGWGGRHLMVGFAGGSIAGLKTNLAIVKGSSLVGVDLRQAAERNPELILGVKNDVLALYKSRQIRVNIRHSVPAEHIAEAEQLMKDRSLVGRVIITF
ncbi:hypothetical protein ASF45_24955 [Pseudorhodoferax sp. Leaf265]|nr:hypothetical protein ASF45_24955 [Pseudorhodoferax sp. Leaf265]